MLIDIDTVDYTQFQQTVIESIEFADTLFFFVDAAADLFFYNGEIRQLNKIEESKNNEEFNLPQDFYNKFDALPGTQEKITEYLGYNPYSFKLPPGKFEVLMVDIMRARAYLWNQEGIYKEFKENYVLGEKDNEELQSIRDSRSISLDLGSNIGSEDAIYNRKLIDAQNTVRELNKKYIDMRDRIDRIISRGGQVPSYMFLHQNRFLNKWKKAKSNLKKLKYTRGIERSESLCKRKWNKIETLYYTNSDVIGKSDEERYNKYIMIIRLYETYYNEAYRNERYVCKDYKENKRKYPINKIHHNGAKTLSEFVSHEADYIVNLEKFIDILQYNEYKRSLYSNLTDENKERVGEIKTAQEFKSDKYNILRELKEVEFDDADNCHGGSFEIKIPLEEVDDDEQVFEEDSDITKKIKDRLIAAKKSVEHYKNN